MAEDDELGVYVMCGGHGGPVCKGDLNAVRKISTRVYGGRELFVSRTSVLGREFQAKEM